MGQMLLLKQNSRISSVSCVPKPLQISIRGFWLARSLVWGSNTRFSHSELILESLYPLSGCGNCHPGVEYVVQLLRWVEAGQIISGSRDLPSALIH